MQVCYTTPMKPILARQSRYCDAVLECAKKLGHATNLEVLSELQKTYPKLSATTVHRITARLVERGELQLAPPALDGAMRFDFHAATHDHFMCHSCGRLRDTTVSPDLLSSLEAQFEDCHISGPITISGLCKLCTKEII